MNQKELTDLTDTLLKSGLANSKSEATRMALKMIETSEKVQQDSEKMQKELPSTQILPEEPVEMTQESVEDLDEDVPEIKESKNDWSQVASNQITSNNEIMKTLETIGRKENTDPNQNLINTQNAPKRYENIQNLYSQKKESGNWLPSKPRQEVKYTGNNNPSENFSSAPVEAPKNESEFTKPVESVKVSEPEPIPEPAPQQSFQNMQQKPAMTPEEYSATRMQGSLNEMIQEEEKEREAELQYQQPSQEPPMPVEPKVDIPIIQEPVREHVQFAPEEPKRDIPQEPEQTYTPQKQEVENLVPKEPESDFLQIKDDPLPEPENPSAPEPVASEEPKKEEKKGRWTEAEEKLRDEVDLSKVFNFGNRQ